ncbi:MAG TPA: hypothetical protein VHC69_14415 [Polyangiaceae bacterium]|nr:hypothetical protein [Polyangiaceae bacterium]
MTKGLAWHRGLTCLSVVASIGLLGCSDDGRCGHGRCGSDAGDASSAGTSSSSGAAGGNGGSGAAGGAGGRSGTGGTSGSTSGTSAGGAQVVPDAGSRDAKVDSGGAGGTISDGAVADVGTDSSSSGDAAVRDASNDADSGRGQPSYTFKLTTNGNILHSALTQRFPPDPACLARNEDPLDTLNCECFGFGPALPTPTCTPDVGSGGTNTCTFVLSPTCSILIELQGPGMTFMTHTTPTFDPLDTNFMCNDFIDPDQGPAINCTFDIKPGTTSLDIVWSQ